MRVLLRCTRTYIVKSFELVGAGSCRDGTGKYPRLYSQTGQQHQSWCANNCSRLEACVAYQYGVAASWSGRCYLYGNGLVGDDVPPAESGWWVGIGNGGSDTISQTDGDTNVVCYRLVAG